MHFPKQVKENSAFEKDLIAVFKNIKFGKARSDFQTTLQLTFAGKTSNMCRLTEEEHNKLSKKAITSRYKKTNTKIKDKINKKGKGLLKKKKS